MCKWETEVDPVKSTLKVQKEKGRCDLALYRYPCPLGSFVFVF